MEDNGIITDCQIKTFNYEPVLNFDFQSSVSINKVVLFSDSFKEVLNDLDTSSTTLKISISPDPSKFKLTTFGNGFTSETDVPSECEMVDAFHCSNYCEHR